MRKLHHIETWTVLLSAATGVACTAAFLSAANPRTLAPVTAEAAAAIGMLALLASMLVAGFFAWRRAGTEQASWAAPCAHQSGDCAACSRKRREVLDERLHIDIPHQCSQYRIACTCWSFCADTRGPHSCAEGAAPATRALKCAVTPAPQAEALPVVQRNGMDNCPFRFLPPAAGSARDDGAAPRSPAAKTTRH